MTSIKTYLIYPAFTDSFKASSKWSMDIWNTLMLIQQGLVIKQVFPLFLFVKWLSENFPNTYLSEISW